MKVAIDPDRCHALVPGVLEIDEVGYATTTSGHISTLDEPGARVAAGNCPRTRQPPRALTPESTR